MKKKTLIIIGIVILVLIGLLFAFRAFTKSHSPAAVAEYHQAANITIHYCKPYKKGRLIFGDEASGALQPYGKFWRIGANEATLFSTDKDLMVNDQTLKAGKYSIYAYPDKENWQIVFNADFDRWGVPAPDPDKDVVKTNVSAINNAPLAEQLNIDLAPTDSNKLNMIIHWDQTEVTLPITIQ